MQNIAINFISNFFSMTSMHPFFAIEFVTFVNTLFILDIIPSHMITEVSAILF